MPYFDPLLGSPDVTHKFFHHDYYNLDAGVGSRCGNLRGDVLLVQYLLKNLYDDHNWIHLRPREALHITGTYDSVTGAYILAFQRRSNDRGWHVQTDGQIHRPPPWPGSKGYTLFYLETYFFLDVHYDLKIYAPPEVKHYMR